jgi:hypothetical protein
VGAAAGEGFMARFTAKFAGQSGKMGLMQLIHTLRATFDAVVAGINPWRVFLYEAPQALQAVTLMGGGMIKILGVVAVAAAAVAALIASPFIYLHRVNSLAKSLATMDRVDIAKPDLSRMSAYEEGWRRIQRAIAAASDEINSANTRFDTMTKLMDQAHATEKKMLELRKQKDMDLAGNSPAQKAALRAKYLKEEHDLEKKQQEEKLSFDARHVMDLQKEMDAKTEQAKAIKTITEKDEAELLKQYEAQVAKNNEREKGKEGTSPVEKAKALVAELTAKGKTHIVDTMMGVAIDTGRERGLGEIDQARLATAQENVAQAQRDQKKLQDFQLAKKDRDEARAEQKRLFAEAEKAGTDKIKAAKAYNDALELNQRILADDDKIRAAVADGKNAKAGKGMAALNADQRIGAYSAAPGTDRALHVLVEIRDSVKHLRPPAHPVVAPKRATFGGIHQ